MRLVPSAPALVLWSGLAAAALGVSVTTPNTASACSGIAMPPAQLYPGDAGRVPNPPQVLLSLNGFTQLEDAYIIPGGPRTPTDPGAIAPATLARYPLAGWGTLVVVSPTAPLRTSVEYQIATRTLEQSELHLLGRFRVSGDDSATPAAPTSLQWFDEQRTSESRDSCRPGWLQALHLTVAGGSSETLWYEVTATSDGAEPLQFALLASPGGSAQGVFYVPRAAIAECVELVAVGVTGQRSPPIQRCRPDKCVVRDINQFPEPPVDWSAISDGCPQACEPNCDEEGGPGLLAEGRGCGCTASERQGPERSAAVGALIALTYLARRRRRAPR